MDKTTVKIIFFGTSEFAVPVLEALAKEGYEIVTVITNPDEPAGRKGILFPPPVKIAAQKLNLNVLQFPSLKIENLKLKIPNADVGIVAAYGKIIPAEIINLFPFGILNIHPSLLPQYRGPTPIQSAILNGEEETGVTIIEIDEEVDHGPILESGKWEIGSRIKFEELSNELAKFGANLLIKILPDYLAGKITPRPQDHSQATFTRKFTREDAKIDWSKTTEEIDRQIRALNPEPGTWTTWKGKILRVLEANLQAWDESASTSNSELSVGKVTSEDRKIAVKTAKGRIILKTVQLEGKKPIPAEDFVRGNRDFIGSVLE